MAKRNVLFILPSFSIGGTTVSTRNIISVLDKNKYDIMVWALNNNGLLSGMYDNVPQLKTCFVAQALALDSWRKEKNWIRRFAAAFIRFIANHSAKIRLSLFRFVMKKCIGNRSFDTVVACQEGFTTEFVSQVPFPNRVAWVRCDYKRYYETIHKRKELFYECYNHIVCVAEQTCKNFVEIYPHLKDRTVCIHNPQDSKLILLQADIDDHDARFRCEGTVILSMGRLSKVKRFSEIPTIARKLIDNGIEFVWYIVGDGEEKAAIEEAIEKNNVSQQVIMLGAKSNPHFYIKRANLYVCLSSSEACPRVINEAKILGTPVVSTDFPTVYEYIEDGVNGIIAPLNELSDAITNILSDNQLYVLIKHEIGSYHFDNSLLLMQIDRLL